MGVLFQAGMFFQQLPDNTVHTGDEAGRPTGGGEEALEGKEMREDF